MNRKSPTKLFKDDKSKECSKCRRIKPHKDFNTTNGRLMYLCKECQKIKDAIYRNKKKSWVINGIYKGKYKKGCVHCSTGLEVLPALQFHHKTPNIKTTSWHDISKKNYQEIIRTLESEKVEVICANCHLKENATLYSEFKDLILNKELFLNTPEKIDKTINNILDIHRRTKNQNSNYRAKIKRQIIFWIKKRYIIEKLFNGECIACRCIATLRNLPALQFHHKLRSKKVSEKWENYSNLGINKIATILQKEECVCVCSNCHTLIHSTSFEKYINQIDSRIEQNVKNLYSKIKLNITHYKFINIELKDPFYKEFGFGDAWKKYIIQIGKMYGIYNPRAFTSKELAMALKITDRYLRRVLNGLMIDNFIEFVEKSIITSKGRTPIKYKLSEKGINTIKDII